MKESLNAWYNRYAILALFVVVGFVAYDRICWQGLTASDWGTWTGAIFAGLAFAGTIWIASSEARNREALGLRTAQLVAAGMVLRLAHAESVMVKIAEKLVSLASTDEALTVHMLLARDIDDIDLWSMDELIHMAPLPAIAIQLAEARDQILTTQRILQDLIRREDVRTSEGRMQFARDFRAPMAITIGKISTSITGCRAQADALHIKSSGMPMG